jgi:hypothetical protein
MGDGLKRAFAATARTRWDGRLSDGMRSFLRALAEHEGPVSAQKLSEPASPQQAHPRRRCLELGLAIRPTCSDGRRRWQITGHGRDALLREAVLTPSPFPHR